MTNFFRLGEGAVSVELAYDGWRLIHNGCRATFDFLAWHEGLGIPRAFIEVKSSPGLSDEQWLMFLDVHKVVPVYVALARRLDVKMPALWASHFSDLIKAYSTFDLYRLVL